MLAHVSSTIRRHDLIPPEGHVLVGVSGGADSVALAHALHYFQARHSFSLTVGHLHHGIRGAEADADAEFVQQLAWKLGAPCVEARVDVPALARQRRISLEMAAREARRDFFRQTARAVGADRVATAHTADDQVETVLLRLLRGAGAQGLGGMPYRADGQGLVLIRPLLDVHRAQIETFLRAHGLSWREDASNRDPYILRNRVRHELLPYLEEQFQPGLRAVLLRTAEVLRDEHAWLDVLAQRALVRCRSAKQPERLVAARLLREPAAARRRVLLAWLREGGVDTEAVDFRAVARLERLAQAGEGQAAASLAGGWHAERSYGELLLRRPLSRASVPPFAFRLHVPGALDLPVIGLRVAAAPARGVLRPAPGVVGQVPAYATVSAARVGRSPILVRSWRPGDRIRPWGMKGTVKLQDVFVDQKMPRADRQRVPVFECDGEIIWVPGYRIARAWAVPSASAASVRLTVERA